MAASVEGQLSHGHAHLTLAAHRLQALRNLLFLLLLQGAEVLDFARELAGLGGHAHRHRAGRQDRQGTDAAPPLRCRASHKASLLLPKGLTRPMPVMTTRRWSNSCLLRIMRPNAAGGTGVIIHAF